MAAGHSILALILLITATQPHLDAQDAAPTFELSFASCPEGVSGVAGTTWIGTLDVLLTTRDNSFDVGAQGWSIAIAGGGVEIVDITTRGTIAARVDDDPPGLRVDPDFEFNELTFRGCCLDDDCSGAISALVLSLTMPITLPPAGTATIAKIVLRSRFPSEPGESRPARVSFLDGCMGSGSPVPNRITFRGETHDPARRECAFELLARPSGFLRGDANDDGARNLSDAVFILTCKFLGGRCPDCRDAGDSNDDGLLDVSDAIHLLGFLFLGGPRPPAPFEACGPDPTADALPECFYLSCEDRPEIPFADFTRLGFNAQGLDEYRHKPTGMTFVKVPRGSFVMGSPVSECGHQVDESPQHRVALEPFLMSKYEVTQGQWRAVMGQNPSAFRTGHPGIPPGTDTDDLPVESITWDEAWTFCQRTGLALPTEAQWEYACRAGSTGPFWFGDRLRPDQARFRGGGDPCVSAAPPGGGAPVVVGSFPPNGFGLHDLHGNVAEWCADLYDERFYQTPAASRPDPIRDEMPRFTIFRRVVRGGSWNERASECRSASRADSPTHFLGSNATRGFRPVWTPRVTLETRRDGRIR